MTATRLQPVRLLLAEFDDLTPEEEDLYYEAFCFYCGKQLERSEYGNHTCDSLRMLRTYYQYERF